MITPFKNWLFFAVLAFAGFEWMLFNVEPVIKLVSVPVLKFSLGGRYNWLAFIGLFVAVGWLADRWANSDTSRGMQYLGLGLYVIAEAIIFLPLLAIAELKGAEFLAKHGQEAHIIRDSAYLTIAIFTGLTLSVFISKKDFSFLRGGLTMVSMGAMGLIVMSLIFGFSLGMVFSAVMVALAGGYILFYTSQVLAHYRPGQHVAAALALFSALALMFWYVVRIMMKLRE